MSDDTLKTLGLSEDALTPATNANGGLPPSWMKSMKKLKPMLFRVCRHSDAGRTIMPAPSFNRNSPSKQTELRWFLNVSTVAPTTT